MPVSMKEKILDAAEQRVRGAGFAEMSFRDLANDVGIKSASVHYHFPTKSDLGEAVVERYADKFEARMRDIDTSDLNDALASFTSLYGEALSIDETICLCAVMGAEAIGLPENVNNRTKAFFGMNTAWLEDLFEKHLGQRKPATAAMIVAALEGGMITASVSKDRALFDRIAETAIRAVRQI